MVLDNSARAPERLNNNRMPDLGELLCCVNNTVMNVISEACCSPSRGGLKWKLLGAGVVVMVGVVIACIADSYHKINEGNVGIYYRHGALLDRVTDPGVHFLKPFIESYIEIMIRNNSHCKAL